MKTRAWLPSLAVIGLAASSAACGSHKAKPQVPRATPPAAVSPAAPQPAPKPVDPIAALVATSQQHYDAGERELKLGHLESARAEFDRALDVLLESPYGARTDARLRGQFDRLVDRINAQEMTSLAQGDGFSEKKDEPASIDELLKIATFPNPPADDETAAIVKADLVKTEHDVDIPDNPRIYTYVELFQGRLREYIEESLRRGSKYLPMIQNVFKAEGIPLDLAYIPIIESGFKTNALSKANAKGPWQFMKATGLDMGLKHDWYVDERSDPEKATVAAAKYLKTLSKMFNGDWHLVLAAYNGGLGRLQRAMKTAGTENFWELSETARFLPKETRDYVPLILAAIVVAKNPVQYGFNVEAELPIEYERVTVPRAVDLRKVAEWTGQTIDDVQALNPELRRWTTPLATPNYQIKVPSATAAAFASRVAAATPDELASLKWYAVQRGESLAAIARKLKVSRDDLAEANQLSVRSSVRVGQELVIPRAPATLLASGTAAAPPAAAPPAAVASRAISGTATVSPSRREPSATLMYQVKQGDTLSSIARLFNTTVDALRNWNRIAGSHIAPGDRLKILAARAK